MPMQTLVIGDDAPDFEADTTEGKIRFHDWLGNSWARALLAPEGFHPRLHDRARHHGADEAGIRQARRQDHRPHRRSGRQPRALGEGHRGDARHGAELSDDRRSGAEDREGLRHAAGSVGTTSDGRTAADNQTVRNVYVIGPDKKIKLVLSYPMTAGRNFDEILRVINSLQLTAKHKVATPANWKQGDDVIISGSVSNDDAKKLWPGGWKEPKPYIRIVPQPQG